MAETEQLDLVGVGLNATDTVIALAAFPLPGSKVEFSTANTLPGGQVASAVIACQGWGMRTRYVGKLGDDEAGKMHRREFARAGVEARVVEVPGGASAQSVILVDGTGERTVLNRRDERMRLEPEELQRSWIEGARILHIDGYDTAAAATAAGWAHAVGILVVADLDAIYPGIEELLPKIDYLVASRDFPCRLMDERNLETALRRMQARYGSRLTAATLGEGGVLAWDGNRYHSAAAYRVPVVDTTGAGDVFHAGFLYGLHRGWPLERQLDFACAAAALNCTAVGARGGIGTVAAIEELMTNGRRYPAPAMQETRQERPA